MADWKHELTRDQYELVIDSILRASTIASVIKESAEHIEPAALKEMASVVQRRILECLVIGDFDEGDVREIQERVIESMSRPADG